LNDSVREAGGVRVGHDQVVRSNLHGVKLHVLINLGRGHSRAHRSRSDVARERGGTDHPLMGATAGGVGRMALMDEGDERLGVDYARATLRMLGFPADAHAGAQAVAEVVFGVGCVERAVMRERSAVARVGGALRLFVHARLSRAAQHWQIAYRTAAWLMAEDGADEELVRRGRTAAQIDAVRCAAAALLLLPRDRVARALRVDGPESVASRLTVPVPATYLRQSEIEGAGCAYVVPGEYVRVRGDRAPFPRDERALERLITEGTASLRLRKVRPAGERGVLLVTRAALRRLAFWPPAPWSFPGSLGCEDGPCRLRRQHRLSRRQRRPGRCLAETAVGGLRVGAPRVDAVALPARRPSAP